jgi:hypothetical protein
VNKDALFPEQTEIFKWNRVWTDLLDFHCWKEIALSPARER